MKYIDFINPEIAIPKNGKIRNELDISIYDIDLNSLKKDYGIENLSDRFQYHDSFCEEAYRMAIRKKLSWTTKAFQLRFFLYQFDLQEDPLRWLDAVERTITYEEPVISAKYSEASNIDTFIVAKETIELILNEPRYHFEKLGVNQQKAIRLNLSLPEIRLINQLLIKSKIIKGNDLPLLEQVLSLNFSSIESVGRISKYALPNKRMEFDAKHTESVTILLNYMKSEISKIEKDL
jgi:hypothetical protein